MYAVKVVLQLAINRWHDFKIKSVSLKELEFQAQKEKLKLDNEKYKLDLSKTNFKQERELYDIKKLSKRFNSAKISNVEMDGLIRLIDAVKSTTYIHRGDIEKAIKKLEQ